MPERPLMPYELASALTLARTVERAAMRHDQRKRALHATGSLMLAAMEAGWTLGALAAVVGVNRSTASKRVIVARRRDPHPHGLVIPPPLRAAPPRRPPTPLDVLRHPLHEREWLTSREAVDHAHISVGTLQNWRDAGLLPHSMWVADRHRWLYLRADLTRAGNGTRYNSQGILYAALLDAIASSEQQPAVTGPRD